MARGTQRWFRWTLIGILAGLAGAVVVPNLVAQGKGKPTAPSPLPGGGVPGGGLNVPGGPGGPGGWMPTAPSPLPGGGFSGPPDSGRFPGGPGGGMPQAPTPQPGGGFGGPPGGSGDDLKNFQRQRNPFDKNQKDDDEGFWVCNSCKKECGRGKSAPEKCPHCGVLLINGIGRGDKPPENNPNRPGNPGFAPPQGMGMGDGNVNLPPVNPGQFPMGSSSSSPTSTASSSSTGSSSSSVLGVIGVVVAVLLVVLVGIIITVVVVSGKTKKRAPRRRRSSRASKPRRRVREADDEDDDEYDRPRRRRRSRDDD